jgi:lipoate-protein ligase A
MVQGRKLVGSAQYRSAAAVLQHGSLPLSEAYSRLPRYLLLSDDDRSRQEVLLREKCITLGEIAPALSLSELVAALMHGFSAEIGCRGRENPWTEEELATITDIMQQEQFRERYRSDATTGDSIVTDVSDSVGGQGE